MKTFALDPNVQRDLAEFLTELCRERVRFVVVGGWAVMSQTQSFRATKDIDLYVSSSDDNLRRVAAVLGGFGAPPSLCSLEALKPADGEQFAGVTFGLPPNRIDLVTKLHTDFDAVHARAESFALEATLIPVASIADLIALKRAALANDPSRKVDRLDLRSLEAALARGSSR